MRFYTKTHKHYCGIDLHARKKYVCILDSDGTVLVHREISCNPESFLRIVAPYRESLVVGVECMFAWYWLADLCRNEKIEFVLGHALYMKAVHGGKAKSDKIDAHKIAVLLRGGMFPLAYVYPPEMRATRDLLRRRNFFVRKRAELMAHIQNTVIQYNLAPLGVDLGVEENRHEVAQLFPDPEVRKIIEAAGGRRARADPRDLREPAAVGREGVDGVVPVPVDPQDTEVTLDLVLELVQRAPGALRGAVAATGGAGAPVTLVLGAGGRGVHAARRRRRRRGAR